MVGKTHVSLNFTIYQGLFLAHGYKAIEAYKETVRIFVPEIIQTLPGASEGLQEGVEAVVSTVPPTLLESGVLHLPAFIAMVLCITAMVLALLVKNGYVNKLMIGIIIGSVGYLYWNEYRQGLNLTGYGAMFLLGSLLPDIDSERSTLGRYMGPIPRWIPHRTITHTFWVVFGLTVGSIILGRQGQYHLGFLTLGYTLHIIADSFSKQGICWFYPLGPGYETFSGGGVIKRGRRAKFAYKAGGVVETLIFAVTLVLNVSGVVFYAYLLQNV